MRLKDEFLPKKANYFTTWPEGLRKASPVQGQSELGSQQGLHTSDLAQDPVAGTEGTSPPHPLCSFSSPGFHPVVPKKKWGFLVLSIYTALFFHIASPLSSISQAKLTEAIFPSRNLSTIWNSLANMIFCTNTPKMFHTPASYFCLHINMIRKYLWLDIHQKVNIYSPSCYFQNRFTMFKWNLLQPTIILISFQKNSVVISSRVWWHWFQRYR